MDWNDYFGSVSKTDTGREQITYIPLDLLDSDEQNFYSLSDVPALADNIATVGLQQPIRVRKHPTAAGRFLIVSGHRRRAALSLLAEEDPEKWKEAACIIQREDVSPALQQLQLIYANSGTRKLSSSDLNEQASQVEKLLYQLQQEGYEFPGRMRDHVAQVMQTTNTKLATLKRIREHLDPCWQSAYKGNILPESTAYELSKLLPEDQQLIYSVKAKREEKDVRWLYADDVKKIAARFEEIGSATCSVSGGPCQNTYEKKLKAASLERWSNFSCGRCCGGCSNLDSCKYVCPNFADNQKRMKEAAREARRQEQKAQEEKERPDIELLQNLWMRFGYARSCSGATVEETCQAARIYFGGGTEKKMKDLEDCVANIGVRTDVPYGYNHHFTYVKTLRNLADLFGCTIDFLLCRTDEPNPPASSDAWSTGEPEAVGQYVALVRCGDSAKLHPYKLKWDGHEWLHSGHSLAETGVAVIRWIDMPEEV